MNIPYEIPESLNNHIIEYKGGGYDGCWWEWNFFMFDSNGTFWNVLSTGRKGVSDEDEARKLIYDADDAHKSNVRLSFTDLSDPADMWAFVDGMVATTAIGIDKFMRKQGLGKLWGHCYECGELRQVRTLDPANFSGDGHGIAYFGKDLVCQVCVSKEVT